MPLPGGGRDQNLMAMLRETESEWNQCRAGLVVSVPARKGRMIDRNDD